MQHDDGHEPSFACWLRAARAGDVNAMSVVAWEYGDGFDADPVVAQVPPSTWDSLLAGAEPSGFGSAIEPENLPLAERCAHALYWDRRAALAGHGYAAERVGYWMLRVGPPHARALPWLERAADAGSGDAARSLADMWLAGIDGAPPSPPTARRWFRRARDHYERALETDQGTATAGWNGVRLGELYLRGEGGRRDVACAIACWERAAERGSAWAMWRLANLYADGEHVAPDFGRACHWWQRAAELGDRDAAQQLTNLPQRRHDAAKGAAAKLPLVQLKRWAERGDVALFRPGSPEPQLAAVLAIAEGSPFNLLSYVITRLEGARQRRAAWGLIEAEARKSPLAAMNLARRHELGWGGAKQDLGATLRWLRHAAKAGEPLAMAGLAQRLQHADYGPPDVEQAAAWLHLARQTRFVSCQAGVDATQLAERLAAPLAEAEATLDAAARRRVKAVVDACDGAPQACWPGD